MQSFRLRIYVYVQRRAHAHTLPALVQLHTLPALVQLCVGSCLVIGLTKRLPEGLVTGRLGGCVGEGATGKVYVGLNINTGPQNKYR